MRARIPECVGSGQDLRPQTNGARSLGGSEPRRWRRTSVRLFRAAHQAAGKTV